jgi:hypothetical protein
LQGVDPAQALKAGKIVVAGDEFGTMADGQCGQVGVGGQIACAAGLLKQLAQDFPIIAGFLGNLGVGVVEPGFGLIKRCLGGVVKMFLRKFTPLLF